MWAHFGDCGIKTVSPSIIDGSGYAVTEDNDGSLCRTFTQGRNQPSSKFLLFGATGDLAKRMLLAALLALHEDALIGGDLEIIATARSEHSDAQYREIAAEALAQYLPYDRKGEGKMQAFLERLSYQALVELRRHRSY
jgi:glucose-6-phosphate 1-dehydrogenase